MMSKRTKLLFHFISFLLSQDNSGCINELPRRHGLLLYIPASNHSPRQLVLNRVTCPQWDVLGSGLSTETASGVNKKAHHSSADSGLTATTERAEEGKHYS